METVTLHGKKAAGRVALVDDEDYDLVMGYRWNVKEEVRNGLPHGPYATTLYTVEGKLRVMLMHKFLTGWPRTDHIDHNGLNNQRSNLRPATHAQNQQNARSGCGTSIYKGVSWDKRARKWRAVIRPERVQRYLGFFVNEEDAARAYDAAALELYGEYACINFPDDHIGRQAG